MGGAREKLKARLAELRAARGKGVPRPAPARTTVVAAAVAEEPPEPELFYVEDRYRGRVNIWERPPGALASADWLKAAPDCCAGALAGPGALVGRDALAGLLLDAGLEEASSCHPGAAQAQQHDAIQEKLYAAQEVMVLKM